MNSVILLAAFVLSALTATAAESRLADAVEKQDRTNIRTLLKQHDDVNAPQAYLSCWGFDELEETPRLEDGIDHDTPS